MEKGVIEWGMSSGGGGSDTASSSSSASGSFNTSIYFDFNFSEVGAIA